MTRKKLIAFIKRKNDFYQFVDFSQYSIEQLKKIKKEIEEDIEYQNIFKNQKIKKKIEIKNKINT